MTSRTPSRLQAEFTDLAVLLARAYLRLTQQSRNDAVSAGERPQKRLDVSATESPHVQDDGGP